MEQQQMGSSFLTGSPAPRQDEKRLALIAHVGGIVIPVVVPLLVMLTRGKESTWVNNQSKEALNFQITVTLGYLISSPLVICVGLGFLTASLVFVVAAILGLLAGLKINDGMPYEYPFALRLVK